MIIDKIRTWSDWKRHWAMDGHGLPEKMGLLHHGFDYPEPNTTAESLLGQKGFFYLCLYKARDRRSLDADETRIAMKAKDVLFRCFFSRIGQQKNVFSSSEIDMFLGNPALLDLCIDITVENAGATPTGMSNFAISLAKTVLNKQHPLYQQGDKGLGESYPEHRKKMLRFLFLTSAMELTDKNIELTSDERDTLSNIFSYIFAS